MKNFIAIDFETASEQRTTPVSVGFVRIVDDVIVEGSSFYSLINPRTTMFNSISIAKHGIKPDMVSDAPDFATIWNTTLKELIKTHIVIIHQTASDISVIKQCVDVMELEKVELQYISTLSIAQKLKIPVEKKGLKDLCKHFNIMFSDKHKSDEDARAVAQLFLELTKIKGFKLQNFIKNETKSQPINNDFHINSIDSILDKYKVSFSELKTINFNGKGFIFWGGSIKDYPEDEIKRRIIEKGGIEKTSINSTVDFFIAGISPGPSKVTQMEIINSSGNKQIKVIDLLFIIDLLFH